MQLVNYSLSLSIFHFDRCTYRLLLSCVTANMFGQMIAAHETPVADRTGELLFARVSAFMTRQLVRARKTTIASFPAAQEWLLA